MAKKAKFNVRDKSNETSIRWDDLIPLYTATSGSLQTAIEALHETGITFKDIIDNNDEIGKIHIGIANTFADLTKELTTIMSNHSRRVKTDDPEKMEFRPYTGEVSKDEKHQEVYLYCVMAYGGLNDKVVQVVDSVLVTLMGAIKEETAKLEKLVDDKLKEKGVEDGAK